MKLMMSLMNKVLPSCQKVSHLSSKGMDEPMSVWERIGLNIHLKLCKLCSRSTEQMDKIHQLAHLSDLTPAKSLRLSDDAKERLIRSLKLGDEPK